MHSHLYTESKHVCTGMSVFYSGSCLEQIQLGPIFDACMGIPYIMQLQRLHGGSDAAVGIHYSLSFLLLSLIHI